MDTGPFDRDDDTVLARFDCDDEDPSRSPLMVEVCNGQDDDCDELVDQDDPDVGALTWYVDADGDGYGDDLTGELLCEDPGDRTTLGGDCDDTQSEVHPDGSEICSFQDDDCDGLIDNEDDSVDPSGFSTWYGDADGDGHGVPTVTLEGCDPGEGYSAEATDCDDSEPLAWEGAEETCGDGVDNDCDSETIGDCGTYGTLPLVESDSTWVGPRLRERVGVMVSRIGDTDGDGTDDWAVGVPDAEGESGQQGQVFLLRAAGWAAHDLASAAGITWTGTEERQDVGRALAGLGDLDGDGWADIAIGAPGTDGGAVDSGAVYLVTAAGSGSAELEDARACLYGGDFAGRMGHSLSAVADSDGDGVAELLVGAFNGGGERAPGQVLLVSGAIEGVVDAEAQALLVLTGARDYSYAGLSSAAGDVDGDGLEDVAVGAPLDDFQGEGAGGVSLVLGGQQGAVVLSDADGHVFGARAEDYLGTSVAFADLDDDGLEDLVVGVPGDSSSEEGAGAVGIFTDPLGVRMLTDAHAVRYGVEAFELAGTALDAGGDYNGDGVADLVVGSPFRPIDVGVAGSAYVLLGPLGSTALLTTADVALWGEADGDEAGASVALIGDQDGDGWPELLIGAPGIGRVYGITGGAGL